MTLRKGATAVVRSFLLAGLVVLLADPIWAKGGGISPGGGGAPAPGGGFGPKAGTDIGDRGRRVRDLPQPSSPGATVTPGRTPPAPSEPPAPPMGAQGLVNLHHGSVRMVAGLARVDLTLEVQNPGAAPLEWQRTYAIDPAAEIIGAVLRRSNEDAITARTLTTDDAQRIYFQIRVPPPTRPTPGGNRDPLLLQRPTSDRLDVSIWPIEPSETVRVELTFVTPLRGHGARRTYVDVMGGPRSGRTPDEEAPARPDAPGNVASFDGKADWLMNPGELVLSSAPAHGMELRGEAGGLLHFAGRAATEASTPRPDVSFLTAQKGEEALLVGSGSFMGRIAVWRFDPRAWLVKKGFDLRENLELRLEPVRGLTRRLAPHVFHASDEPRPVTALLVSRDAASVAYEVQVRDRNGLLVERFPEEQPLRREDVDPLLEAAVTGWHRAGLVRRVLAWSADDPARRLEAVRFAVDLGVLAPGSAALAVPENERQRLTPRNRRLYDSDGVPLGAPRHEADLKAPPRGALDD